MACSTVSFESILKQREVIVTSDDSNKLYNCRVSTLETGAEIAKFKRGNSKARCLSFICDDHLISSLVGQKVLNVWSLGKSHKVEHRIDCVGHVIALAVSPKGNHCVGAIGSKIYVWQIVTGDLFCILTDHFRDVSCIKFSDNGKYFVSGAMDELVICWDLGLILESLSGTESPKPMHVWRDHSLGISDIHIGSVYASLVIVATVSRDKTCKIFDLFSGMCIYSICTEEMLHSVTMDRFQRYLCLGTDSGAIIQAFIFSNVSEESMTIGDDNTKVFKGHKDAVTCLSISSDGRYLLSGSKDTMAILWDISTLNCIRRLRHEGPVTNAFITLCPRALIFKQDTPQKMQIQPFHFSTEVETDTCKIALQPHYLCTEPAIGDDNGYTFDEEPAIGDDNGYTFDEEPAIGDDNGYTFDEEPAIGDDNGYTFDEEPAIGDDNGYTFDEEMEADMSMKSEDVHAEIKKTMRSNKDLYLRTLDFLLRQASSHE